MDTMEDFFKTVAEVRGLIEKISSQAEEVEGKHGVILSSPNQNTRCKDELELLNNQTKTNANLVRAKLKAMHDGMPVDDGSTGASVIKRIQRNQVMRDYHETQISFREKCKAQIQRQLEIVDKVTTDEELEEMLNCDNLTIFISDIKSDARTSRQALSEIESRHRDIVSLESSIKELQEIFADTAMLLEMQGELMNSIEKNVTSAEEYTDISTVETDKALQYKKNPHKIASFPRILRSFRRRNKNAADQNTPNLNHN